MLLNFLYEIRKVFNRVLAKILHCIEAKHAVTLELRFGEKLVSRALVRKCLALLKVFVDVAWLIAIAGWLYVNDYAVGRFLSVHVRVHCRIAYATNCTAVGSLAGSFQCVDLAAGI